MDDLLTDMIAGARQVTDLCEESLEAMRGRRDTYQKDVDKLTRRMHFADDMLAVLEAAQMARQDRKDRHQQACLEARAQYIEARNRTRGNI